VNLSLRDWLAGQALAGMMAGVVTMEWYRDKHAETVAESAYALADAMLKVREVKDAKQTKEAP
jgi:hypothetical protein